jgi:feruloyl esterase
MMLFLLALNALFAPTWGHPQAAVIARDADAFATACANFASTAQLPANVTLGFTEFVAAGSNVTYREIPSVCATTPQTVRVDLCRVYMNVSTSAISGLRLEAWLPRNYSGRFLSTGNGGLGGCIQYTDLAYGTNFGFATVGANNGHDGNTGVYFLNNTEVLEDFAYRSVHTGTVVGKQITKAFYNSLNASSSSPSCSARSALATRGYTKSYYMGCSTGGREGMYEAQNFPDDFDGILAGAPAMNYLNLNSWGGYAYNITGPPGSSTFLTSAQWAIVHTEIMRQCDFALDGADDGVIEDTDLCHPVMDALLCTSASVDNSTCLTAAQANTVLTLLSDWYGPDGSLYYPRLNPGAEASMFGLYLSGTMFSYTVEWYKYVVMNSSTWDYSTWTPADGQRSLEQNSFNIQTWNPDLSPFNAKGGKLLHYHGTADQVISSDNSKLYWRNVHDAMAGVDLDQFYRFFPISGMAHCSGGAGASMIGQSFNTYLASAPENNLLLKLVDWVENGSAPEYARGAKLAADGTSVQYFRKHCKYPAHNVYVGPGNWTEEAAWECQEP